MKRTSSMYYNPTAESQSLALIIGNNLTCWRAVEDTHKMLLNKVRNGQYNRDLAADAFYNGVMNNTSVKNVIKGTGACPDYSVNARFTVCCDLVKDFEDRYK